MSRVSFALIHWQKKILSFFSVFLFSLFFSRHRKKYQHTNYEKWNLIFLILSRRAHEWSLKILQYRTRVTDVLILKRLFLRKHSKVSERRFIIIPTTRRDFPLFRHENATTACRQWGEINNFQCFWHAHWNLQHCRMFQNKNHRFWILALLLLPPHSDFFSLMKCDVQLFFTTIDDGAPNEHVKNVFKVWVRESVEFDENY